MKNIFLTIFILVSCTLKSQAYQYDYETSVTFPANYTVGKYFEFAQAEPIAANASGYYEISIAYTRGSVAAASTHIATISHANPDLWRETGVANANDYTQFNHRNFAIDVNGNQRKFRIRAINTYGVLSETLTVNIKIRSINFNASFTALNATGSDTTVTNLQPMTDEWDLYVGNGYSSGSANIGLKVISNGNVGIGISNPQNKLDVNGVIHAKEVKVDLNNWADYVFRKEYDLPSLEEVERHIQEKGHLPNIPSEKEVLKNGISLGENQKLLLQKIEELTLYSIEQNRKLRAQSEQIERQSEIILNLKQENLVLKSLMERIEKLEQSSMK